MDSSRSHIMDVARALAFFSSKLMEAAACHDYDKLSDIDLFHGDFVTGFRSTEWWDNHRKLHRHHLMHSDGCPDDVNLLDILEYISDCVMAGSARTGKVFALEMQPDLLMVAFQNTVELLKSQIVVRGDQELAT